MEKKVKKLVIPLPTPYCYPLKYLYFVKITEEGTLELVTHP